jgi:hypothetical protein
MIRVIQIVGLQRIGTHCIPLEFRFGCNGPEPCSIDCEQQCCLLREMLVRSPALDRGLPQSCHAEHSATASGTL